MLSRVSTRQAILRKYISIKTKDMCLAHSSRPNKKWRWINVPMVSVSLFDGFFLILHLCDGRPARSWSADVINLVHHRQDFLIVNIQFGDSGWVDRALFRNVFQLKENRVEGITLTLTPFGVIQKSDSGKHDCATHSSLSCSIQALWCCPIQCRAVGYQSRYVLVFHATMFHERDPMLLWDGLGMFCLWKCALQVWDVLLWWCQRRGLGLCIIARY